MTEEQWLIVKSLKCLVLLDNNNLCLQDVKIAFQTTFLPLRTIIPLCEKHDKEYTDFIIQTGGSHD